MIDFERSRVEISLNNYLNNINNLKQYFSPSQSFMQIVKADAYGHGAYEISKAALSAGAVYLGVANVEEGKLLRTQGIKAPIMVLSPSLRNEINDIIEYDLTPSISDITFIRELHFILLKTDKKIKVHLKIDTGMHRSGFNIDDIQKLINEILCMQHIEVEGVFSHFAASENDSSFTASQYKLFLTVLRSLPFTPKYIHITNSSGLIASSYPETNIVRLGILSFGIYTDPNQKDRIDLKPVMTFKSSISQIKDLKKGDYVGYNRTWQASSEMKYAIIPIGYADGYDYLLSNKGYISIRGKLCPVIGKISMDMITVDLSPCKNACLGDEAILMGGDCDELRAESLTAKYSGSPYELLCQIGRRAKRFYYHNDKLVSSVPLSRRYFVSTDFNDSKLTQIIESAINQRLQNDELSDLIFREILRTFFYNKDREIRYRQNFKHCIEFKLCNERPDYYLTTTTLTFEKELQQDYFIVACANSEPVLNKYFLRPDVQYRWLMDTNFAISTELFEVTSTKINNIDLKTQVKVIDGCLEIRCSSDELKDLIGSQVLFSISTKTYYPIKSHQMSVFINELTKGIEVCFVMPGSMKDVEAITVFSGQNRYPEIIRTNQSITIKTNANDWVFPTSGIIFSY